MTNGMGLPVQNEDVESTCLSPVNRNVVLLPDDTNRFVERVHWNDGKNRPKHLAASKYVNPKVFRVYYTT